MKILKSNTIFVNENKISSILNMSEPFVSFTNDINFYKKSIVGFENWKKECCLEFDYSNLKNLKHSKWVYKGDFNKPNYSNEKEIRFFQEITNVKSRLNKIIFFPKNSNWNSFDKFEKNTNNLSKYLEKNNIDYEIYNK